MGMTSEETVAAETVPIKAERKRVTHKTEKRARASGSVAKAAPAKPSEKQAKRKPVGKATARTRAPKGTSRKRGSGRRYSAAEKAKILAAAKKEGLTGAEVAKRFGVATLTFYRWRGPVRSDAVARRGPGQPAGSGRVHVDQVAVRKAVQEQVRKILPQIIREEIEAVLR